MSLTPSSMIPLGTIAPNFTLTDTVTDKAVSMQDLKSDKATVVMFICNHCPFVLHIQDKLVEITDAYKKKGIQFIAICSNDITTHPEDGPEKMKVMAQQKNYSFPYLYDQTQQVAKDYAAECTPDFFVFDKDLACVYRGRFDESSPGKKNIPVTGADLTRALDAIIAGQAVDTDQHPSQGCNIKWKD